MPAPVPPEMAAMDGSVLKPSCPGLYATTILKADYVHRDHDETIYTPAECNSLEFNVECHLATAFVTCKTQWMVPSKLLKSSANQGKNSCTFALPMDQKGIVTSISANMKKMSIQSCVVPLADTGKFSGKRFGRNGPEPCPVHPEVFAIAIPNVPANEVVDIEVTYFQPLKFEEGAYIFEAPTTLPKGSLPQGAMLKDIVHIMTTVRGARPEPVMVECKSHPVSLVQAGPGVTQVMIDPKSNKWGNGNYLMRMPVWSPSISAAAVQQPSPDLSAGPTADTRAPFVISISPPDPKSCAPFARSVFFIVDRSGSMTGKPMAGANQALLAGIESLGPQDTFNICAFDNLQEYLSEDMVPASGDNINAAKGWIQGHCTARGTTDILTPLQGAVAILSKRPAPNAVPLIYVVTDGAVENEREICSYMQEVMLAPPPEGLMTHPRVCTFGIGRYCNHYFLKMLSQIGKGLCDAAYTDEMVGSQMTALIKASKTPVLTDVEIGIPGAGQNSKVEVYPFPVPDLYIGAPVMVAGKIQGGLPPNMSIKGRLAGGEVWESTIPVAPDLENNNLNIPLDKVFIKERIDMLTAVAWLTNNKSAESDVVALSLQYGVPCPHTKLCAFEVDPKKAGEVAAAKKKGGAMKIAKYAVGGAAGIMVLGALAGADFGNVGASLANAAGGIGDLGSVLGGINLPSGIDIPDIDLGVCGDACGSICEPVAGCLGPCLGSVGDVAGDAVGAIGDVAESAIDVVANVVESLS